MANSAFPSPLDVFSWERLRIMEKQGETSALVLAGLTL